MEAEIKLQLLKDIANGDKFGNDIALAKDVLAVYEAINRAERLISEAIRVGCGRGEEYAIAAHRCLTGTGIVTGYSAKPQSQEGRRP